MSTHEVKKCMIMRTGHVYISCIHSMKEIIITDGIESLTERSY